MTNDEIRRNDEIRMTKPATAPLRVFRHSGFGFLSSFVIRHSSFKDLCKSGSGSQCMRKKRKGPLHQPTHRTSNFQLPMGHCLPPCSMFGVGCWMLDVLIAALHRAVSRRLARFFIGGCLLLGLNAAHSEETNKVQHAKLKISGFGLMGNRDLKKTIRLMSGKKTPPEFYDANFVED